MRDMGFSTGALALGNFREALRMLAPHCLPCLELSALRVDETSALVESLPLDLTGYSYVSFHAPSRFERAQEGMIADLLFEKIPENWPIVMHPDTIFDFGLWRRFGPRLAIENMDRRKQGGRNVAELNHIFAELPDASLCFDIGHARQYDSSMTEAFLILNIFAKRLVQVHVSEVNSASQHDPISYGAKLAFQQVANLIPTNIPIIVESRVGEDRIMVEIRNARQSLNQGRDQPKSDETAEPFPELGLLTHSFG